MSKGLSGRSSRADQEVESEPGSTLEVDLERPLRDARMARNIQWVRSHYIDDYRRFRPRYSVWAPDGGASVHFIYCPVHSSLLIENIKFIRQGDGSYTWQRVPWFPKAPYGTSGCCRYCTKDQEKAVAKGKDWCRPSPSQEKLEEYAVERLEELCIAAQIVVDVDLGGVEDRFFGMDPQRLPSRS